MTKATLVLLGKLPPPYMGPSVATQILLQSELTEHFNVIHVDTNVHESLETLGKFRWRKIGDNVAIYRNFVRTLRRCQPDVVLVPISQATLGFLKDSVFIICSRLLGRTTLLQLRGSNLKNWLAGCMPPTRWYVESVLRKAQGVIVLGNNLRHLFERYFPSDRIFVVPNGADFDLPAGSASAETKNVRVLYVGNLQPSKGIQDVVAAVSELVDDGVGQFELTVVGQWRDEATQSECERLVNTKGLPIRFAGAAFGSDKLAFFAQADIFVFAPREPEGHPWVIVEAMASGLPIISTDQGAIVESVRDGQNGFIVSSASPAELAARLRELVESDDLRLQMGEESRRLYNSHFTEARMVENLKAAVNQLLAPAVPGRQRDAAPLADVT